MRTKIGTKIGPVPITLAVFALAAVLSVGLLVLATGGGNVTQAQGLGPSTTITPAVGKCEVTVIASNGDEESGRVSGSGCNVTGDTVDVVLKNASTAERAIAVYTTGGDEYNVQAMGGIPVGPLGRKGVNEDLFDLDAAGTKVGGGADPGSETITVSRDMAADGEVYLFVYHALNTPNTAATHKTFADTDIGHPVQLALGHHDRHRGRPYV